MFSGWKRYIHATQFAAWQRGPNRLSLENVEPMSKGKLHVLPVMETLIPSNMIAGKTKPSFESDVDADWFKVSIDSCPSALSVLPGKGY